jgi:hypothetical protein
MRAASDPLCDSTSGVCGVMSPRNCHLGSVIGTLGLSLVWSVDDVSGALLLKYCRLGGVVGVLGASGCVLDVLLLT